MRLLLKIITILLLFFFIMSFYIVPFYSRVLYREEITYPQMNEKDIIINSTITTFLLVSLPLLWLYSFNGLKWKKILEDLKITRKNTGKSVVLGLLSFSAMVLILIIAGMVTRYLGIEIENEVGKNIAVTLSISSILYVVIMQATSEEIFFRGFLMEKLSIKDNRNTGIILSSILFGFAHLSYGTPHQVILPFIVGCLFGYTLKRSENIISVIIPHALYDILALLIARYLPTTLLSQSCIPFF